ncbi:MAG: hypothetical protein H8D97_00340 [Proteobacteria bacterium]|nr:hypothetical protein [Pseudomonadota bacterium]
MNTTADYIKYIISKTDLPRHREYPNENQIGVITLNINKFNRNELDNLMKTNNFKNKFDEFVKLQTIIYNRKINVCSIDFLKGIISYMPIKDRHNYIFVCCKKEAGVINFNELYSKRCKKIIGHIILEDKFDKLIYHLEERILLNI